MPNGKVPTREEFWRLYPGEPYPYEETPDKGAAFWEWVDKTYTPEQVKTIKSKGYNYTDIWAFFLSNVWEKPEALPRGRPQPAKYGINEGDWQVLMMLGGSPKRTQAELEKWIGTGYINQYQARDIWDELNVRVRQAELGLFYPETAPELKAKARKEEIARLKETGVRGLGDIPQWQLETWRDQVAAGGITEEEVGRYIERREETQAKRARARAWRYAPPQPEYARAFEEERLGLGGAQPWKTWFESQYPTLVGRFRATLPRMEQAAYPGLTPSEAEKQIEETWAERLRKGKPELREEYAKRYPYGMGARPWAMAPRIQTVRY